LHTIVEHAKDGHFDLVVMGTHGRTGLAHLLMGSVAEAVARRAPCPVLTVRQTPRPAEQAASTSATAAA
jgi:universal stress protein A